MNKKECNEIKKLFTPANCAISRICGCYVDAEKNKKTELKEAFSELKKVVLVTGVSDDLIAQARQIIRQRKMSGR